MLRLATPSDPQWIDRALSALDEVLLDHAHCEKKAASTAVSLIFRYQEHPELMVPLSRLAREELQHFEEMIEVLEARNIAFRRLNPSSYAGELMKIVRADEPNRMLDMLLCAAFIEARSCERMRILSENLQDPELVRTYKGLLASEARHHQTYVELAAARFDAQVVEARLLQVAAHEADVIARAPHTSHLHGG